MSREENPFVQCTASCDVVCGDSLPTHYAAALSQSVDEEVRPIMAKTEMWQRLRAARKAAGLTQKALADALDLTRAGYAWLEWKRPAGRVQPSLKQLKTIAEITRVPIEMLASDETGDSDIWRVAAAVARGDRPQEPVGQVSPPPPAPVLPSRVETQQVTARMRQMFWHSVEFAVLAANRTMERSFSMSLGPLGLQADFILPGKAIAAFVDGPERVLHCIAMLALVEDTVRRPMDKHLFVWQPDVTQVLLDALPWIESALRIQVHEVCSPEQAARSLLSLGLTERARQT